MVANCWQQLCLTVWCFGSLNTDIKNYFKPWNFLVAGRLLVVGIDPNKFQIFKTWKENIINSFCKEFICWIDLSWLHPWKCSDIWILSLMHSVISLFYSNVHFVVIYCRIMYLLSILIVITGSMGILLSICHFLDDIEVIWFYSWPTSRKPSSTDLTARILIWLVISRILN